jgi:hypothetical protein
VFRISFISQRITETSGWPQAEAELQLGAQRIAFLVDLRYWSRPDYESQWRAGIARLARGGRRSCALMMAYRGPLRVPHIMWALWREGGDVYIQEQSVLSSDLKGAFDPRQAHAHVGERIRAVENGLPISEYRVEWKPVLSAYLASSFTWQPRTE